MIHLCAPTDCPSDPNFEHDNYFGCIPKDFSATTGRSKKYRQTRGQGWNGGCDPLRSGASRSGQVATVPAEPVRQSDTASTVSDGAPIVRGAGDPNGIFVADTAGATQW